MPGSFPPNVIAAAQASRRKWNIPASVCLAQWALESAWGKSMPAGSNNPFGIKAVGMEPCVSCQTHEVVHGRRIAVTAKFRKFPSVEAAFDAHGELLATGKPYAKARAVRTNATAFATALTGVYATDPHYGTSLIGLMRAYDLYQYDAAAAPDVPKPPAKPETPSTGVTTAVPLPPDVPSPGPLPASPPPNTFWNRLKALFGH